MDEEMDEDVIVKVVDCSNQSEFKLCKVRSVQFGQKGIPYLNTYDGRTIRYPDPLIKANDTIKIDLETNKIMDFIKLYLPFHGFIKLYT
ncbi:40S ribosomal protein S4-3 [Zea mays]|uniref:40S ribosomal protein S4-3 n=1 Tax=Zea mays TaxID=4577 RepID=A0A1D6L1X6_MAIZE|nr:40S ribosomal protein S4-3 [Zea mays]